MTEALLLLVNAIEALFVRVRNLRLGLLVYLLNAVSIYTFLRSLHLQLFEDVIGPINIWLSFLVDLEDFFAFSDQLVTSLA